MFGKRSEAVHGLSDLPPRQKTGSEQAVEHEGMLNLRYQLPGAAIVPCVVESTSKNQSCEFSTNVRPTDWAKTRCKNTCITTGGFGKTALTICASVSTVALISENKSVSPSSVFGGLASGSGIEFQLREQVRKIRKRRCKREGQTGLHRREGVHHERC